MYMERKSKQNRIEMVMLEELVPQEHLLRKIDAVFVRPPREDTKTFSVAFFSLFMLVTLSLSS